MIRISDSIAIDESDISISFARAAGPGGQNVNKVETAVELRFDVAGAFLPEDLKLRLKVLAGRQMTQNGILVITAQEFRSQERNRARAMEKLVGLLRRAALRPRKRIATRPTKASRARRLETKSRRSQVKRMRSKNPTSE